MSRPASLAEVAAVVGGGRSLDEALAEFLDGFYPKPAEGRQRALDPVPDVIGDAFSDAMLGAAGEHLARRWDLRVPEWTARAAHYALAEPRFVPCEPNLRGVLLVESPAAFRSRMLFVVAEPLRRARFPTTATRAEVCLPFPAMVPDTGRAAT